MSATLLTLINSSEKSLQDKIAEMANLSQCGRKGTTPEELCCLPKDGKFLLLLVQFHECRLAASPSSGVENKSLFKYMDRLICLESRNLGSFACYFNPPNGCAFPSPWVWPE